MIARPCRVGDCHFSLRVKGAVAAGGCDHDRAVILRAENLRGHVNYADIDETAWAQLKFQKSLAIGAKRHFIVDTGNHDPEMSRRHIPLGDRFEVEYVEGFLRIGNETVKLARRPHHRVRQPRRPNVLCEGWCNTMLK